MTVPDVSATTYPDEDESRCCLHVAITRAVHQLWIIEVGQRSPILESAAVGVTRSYGPG